VLSAMESSSFGEPKCRIIALVDAQMPARCLASRAARPA
jgi:hypothetical protein